MNKKEVTLKSNQIFNGKVIKVFLDNVKCPNGNESTREVVKHRGGVCMLGIIDNKAIMEKQYRYAFDEELYELPAGKLEENENPLEAAKREFEEETGNKVLEIEDYGEMYPTCGYSNEIIHLYYVSKFEKSCSHLDPDETLEVILIDIDKVVDMINNNIIKDAKTICLISKYLSKHK